MSLSREAIVEGLRRIVGPEAVVTDEKILVESSVDNFRKLQNIFDVHTMPVPAAVALPPTPPRSPSSCASRATTASTSSRGRAARRPKAGSRAPCPTPSSSTAR